MFIINRFENNELLKKIEKLPTRHAEIGALNALPIKSCQSRLLKKSTLVVLRFIQKPPKKKWANKRTKQYFKKMKKMNREINTNNNNNNNNNSNNNSNNNNSNDFDIIQDCIELACSRPCCECLKVLKALNLKSVIYCDEDGKLVNESPQHIIGSVHSGGTKDIINNKK